MLQKLFFLLDGVFLCFQLFQLREMILLCLLQLLLQTLQLLQKVFYSGVALYKLTFLARCFVVQFFDKLRL